MSWRVPRCKDGCQGAITVNVVEVVLRSIQELPFQSRTVKILSDVATAGKPVRREGIFIFRPLHDVRGIGEPSNGTRVVKVKVRLQDIFHISRINAERLDLIDAPLVLIQDRPSKRRKLHPSNRADLLRLQWHCRHR